MQLRVCPYLLVLGLSLPLRAAPPPLDPGILIDTSSRFAERDPGGNRAEASRLPLRHSEVRADDGRYLLTLDEAPAEGRPRDRSRPPPSRPISTAG